jgi:hypothetical protein
MISLQDRRVQVAVATAAVLLLVLLLVSFCALRGGRKAPPPEAAQHGQLQVEMGKEEAKLDPARPLRCFVNGQFVGEETLVECARKNGVAAQNLDVGLDQTGQVAAAQTGQTALVPLPSAEPDAATELLSSSARPPAGGAPRLPPVSAGPTAQCLRFAGGDWRDAGQNQTLQACVHTLYDGRCARSGEAFYGRFGAQTLRHVPGRVEISNDNHSFRLLQETAADCPAP